MAASMSDLREDPKIWLTLKITFGGMLFASFLSFGNTYYYTMRAENKTEVKEIKEDLIKKANKEDIKNLKKFTTEYTDKTMRTHEAKDAEVLKRLETLISLSLANQEAVVSSIDARLERIENKQ